MPEVLAAAAVLSLGYGVYSGERQASAGKKGLQRQREAEGKAEAQGLAAERKADQERNRTRQQQPDLGVLLNDQQPKPGALGIDVNSLLLGNRFLGR